MVASDVAIKISVRANLNIQGVVQNANMMRVLHLEQCSTR